jgi:hypothetical protein
MLTPAAKQTAEALPREAIKESSNEAYKSLRNSGVPLQPAVVEDLSTKIRDELIGNEYGFRPRNQDRTFTALEELKKPEGEHVVFADIDSVRQQLGHVIRDKPGSSDALAASIARERIDDYLSNIPEFAAQAKQARGDWAAVKRSELLTGEQERGELNAATSGVGANKANSIKQRAKAILVNPKQRAKFNPEEQELLQEVSRGSTLSNLARHLARLGPKHPLTGWGSALAADLTGGHGMATGSLFIGAVSQWLSERLTVGKFERVEEMTRARAPSSVASGVVPKQRMPYGVPPAAAAAAPVAAGAAMSPGGGGNPMEPGGGGPMSFNPMDLLVSPAAATESTDRKNPLIGRIPGEAPGGGGITPQTVIPPSSPTVKAAITRASAYVRGGNNEAAMQNNIRIMERGGPMAEKLADHLMKTFSEHPLERALPATAGRTIEGDASGGK